MSVTSGFFNSIEGDRVYNADDFSRFYDGLTSDGVFRYFKGELGVGTGGGMSVKVAAGKAIVLGKYVENTQSLDLEITGGNNQPRYDAVVAGVDLDARTGDIYIKSGTPAASPAYPVMENNATKKELCIAYVYVPANPTAISIITDKRADQAVCGWVALTDMAQALKTYRSSYTVTDNDKSVIPVGIPQYNPATDTLLAYKNGFFLQEGTDYTVQGTGEQATIVMPTVTANGNGFNFVVLKLDV